MLSSAVIAPFALILVLLHARSVGSIIIHSTCKNMAGVDEYGYGPDVSDAISSAYENVRTISANAANILENYQGKKLPPTENARIASILTAFGLRPGDDRESMFILLATAAWGLLSSKIFLEDIVVFCGTPEGPNQWKYVPKTPLGKNWAWRNYMVSPVYESQDRYQICQDPTHKGPRYSANTLAFAVQKGVSICAAGFQGMPPSGFPTTLEERAEDRSKIKGENQLKFWGRSLVGILMHELHHTVSPSNIDEEIPEDFAPPGFPKTGVLVQKSHAYDYAGVAALANFVQSDISEPANTLTHNPDTMVYLAMAIWLFGNSWVDNVAKPVPGGVDSNPADQQVAARRMIRDAMKVPHFDNTGIMGTRFLS